MGLRGFALSAMAAAGMISQPGVWGRFRPPTSSTFPFILWTPNRHFFGSMKP